MAEVTTINVSIDKSKMYNLYKLKIGKKWNWEKLILNTTDFYLLHNEVEGE